MLSVNGEGGCVPPRGREMNRKYIFAFLCSLALSACAANQEPSTQKRDAVGVQMQAVTIPNAFSITVKTDNTGTSNSTSFTIPTVASSTYNYNVDWNGDGIIDQSGITGSVTHDYLVAGTYQINITGTFPRIYFINGGDRQKMLSIDQWGNNAWTSMEVAFDGCVNMRMKATDTPNLSNVLTMNRMFAGAPLVGDPTDGANWNWDTSNVVTMTRVFYMTSTADQTASLLNVDLSSWNTSNVTDMSFLFSGCQRFNNGEAPGASTQPLNWNTAKVVGFAELFRKASSYNQPMVANGLGVWDLGNALNLGSMFSSATLFNNGQAPGQSTAPLNWNVSKVTNLGAIFSGASSFNQPLPWNTISATTMASAFQSATLFNQDLNGWKTGMVTTMASMFNSAIAFNQDLNDWDVSLVQNMSSMFSTATAFNGNITGWQTPSLTTVFEMFRSAVAFDQDIGGWDMADVTTTNRMFLGATKFNQDIGDWIVTSVSDFQYMFSGATKFNQDLGRWQTPSATIMLGVFRSTPFNYDISGWDMSHVTTMESMFENTTAFNQDIGGWQTPLVTNFYRMFKGAAKFDQDIGDWNVAAGTNFGEMFMNAKLSIPNYDKLLIGWDIQALQSGRTFHGGTSQYCAGTTARTNMISSDGWSFTDSGLSCPIVELGADNSGNEDTGANRPLVLVKGAVSFDTTVTIADAGTGTATASSDYTFTGTLTIPAGTYDGTSATGVTISTLSISADSVIESDETVNLTLTGATNLVIGDANGDMSTDTAVTYTILNDDFQFCGNGTVESPEPCDDGGESTSCNADCTVSMCGDGILNNTAGEACDDEGQSANCNANCTVSVCGDGVWNSTAGESCDGGGESIGCNADCTVAECGDGIVNSTAGEACDDGDPDNTNACNNSCLKNLGEVCGNGTECASAFCDEGICACDDDSDCGGSELCNLNTAPNVCVNAGCGNGVLEASEGCDDGNSVDGDGCSGACSLEVGEACNEAAPGEVGNASCASGICDATAGAPGICEAADVCGNSVLEVAEACDDGNVVDGDGCSSSCLLENGENCTDSTQCVSGQCDVGVTDVCTSSSACGDGIIDDGEGCDDGNTDADDGCSDTCEVEGGFVCVNEPSECTTAAAGCTSNTECDATTPVCDQSDSVCKVCIDSDSGDGVDEGCNADAPQCETQNGVPVCALPAPNTNTGTSGLTGGGFGCAISVVQTNEWPIEGWLLFGVAALALRRRRQTR
ncbi:MAG: BspA family leucine-rich repeat surface protein [Polyangiales bacterium]